ncbi:MAG: hypothetical protein LBL72_02105 [Candidatus Accumulibacter sp.]|jgi:uncharacterized membrane protein|nr:hypothetical protein [Accumulibacter sp.]
MNANWREWNGDGRAVRLFFWLFYPLLIFFGLRFFEPRYLALLLGGLVVLRNLRSVKRFVAGRSRIDAIVFFTLLVFSAVVAFSNDEFILRLYPVVVNLGSLALFAFSLFFPPSIVERFARLSEPDLPEAGVVYTRRVTCLWCVFFVFNGLVAAYTALYASREFWALYNGFIAYLLMGALFAGEWCCRRYFRREAVKER